MPAAVRRTYVTVGVALVGASVISATPIEPPQVDMRAANADVRLAASVGDIVNVPANLFDAIASLPANEVQALDRSADAMLATGSWDVWSPTNVFGFDALDRQRLKAIVDLLVPFPALSSVIGEWLSVWSQANLPMNPGCAALPGACPDPAALLSNMFKVSVLQLFTGYTFPEVVNPFDGSHPEWSGQHVQLDPFEQVTAVVDYFLAPPSGVETVSLEQTFTTVAKFAKSLWVGFYPFVQNSEWFNPDTTGFAYLFRPLAPILCQDCDPQNPYDNPWLYQNYDPHYPSSTSTSGQTVTLDVANLAAGEGATTNETINSEAANGKAAGGDSAIADLVNKPDVAPGDVKQRVDPGNQVQILNDQQSGLPAEDLRKAPDSTAAGVGTVPQEQAGATGGATTPSTQQEKNGNKAVPGGSSGGKHGMPGGGLSDTFKSVQDKINSGISKVTDSLKGDTAKGSEDTTKSGTGAGNTGE
jgi:hypothetical protein